MGGANDGTSAPSEADLEEIYGDDAAAAWCQMSSTVLMRLHAAMRN